MIQLVLQYCSHPLAEREVEYRDSVMQNLANPWVAGVWDLCESGTAVPPEITAHRKYHHVPLEKWATYADVFDFARRMLFGEPVALVNLDIALSHQAAWDQAARLVCNYPVVLALFRYELTSDGKVSLEEGFRKYAFGITQDAWLFRGGIAVQGADFEIGTLGCDNAIAHRFKEAGLQPVNLGSRFQILHRDECRGKNFENQAAVHHNEARRKPPRRYPERNGYYLVPEAGMIRLAGQPLEIDRLLDGDADTLAFYARVCQRLTQEVRVWHD